MSKRNIDYANYPIIDLGENIPLNCGNYGRYEIRFPKGTRFGIFKSEYEAIADFEWYMENYRDTNFGAKNERIKDSFLQLDRCVICGKINDDCYLCDHCNTAEDGTLCRECVDWDRFDDSYYCKKCPK